MKKCRDCTGENTYYRCPSCEVKRKLKFNAKEITINAEMGIKLLSIVSAYIDVHMQLQPKIGKAIFQEYKPIIEKLEKLLYKD